MGSIIPYIQKITRVVVIAQMDYLLKMFKTSIFIYAKIYVAQEIQTKRKSWMVWIWNIAEGHSQFSHGKVASNISGIKVDHFESPIYLYTWNKQRLFRQYDIREKLIGS